MTTHPLWLWGFSFAFILSFTFFVICLFDGSDFWQTWCYAGFALVNVVGLAHHAECKRAERLTAYLEYVQPIIPAINRLVNGEIDKVLVTMTTRGDNLVFKIELFTEPVSPFSDN